MLLRRKGGNASSGGWRSTPPSAGEWYWRSPAAVSVCWDCKLLLTPICVRGQNEHDFPDKNVPFRENMCLETSSEYRVPLYIKLCLKNYSWSSLNLDWSSWINTQLPKRATKTTTPGLLLAFIVCLVNFFSNDNTGGICEWCYRDLTQCRKHPCSSFIFRSHSAFLLFAQCSFCLISKPNRSRNRYVCIFICVPLCYN